jgi:hypothetical protein
VKGMQRSQARLTIFTGLILLGIRGVALWLVVPVSLIAWPCLWPILRRRNIQLSQFLGWVDLNLISAIEHSVLRPLIEVPLPWTSTHELPNVTHRIGISDPA